VLTIKNKTAIVIIMMPGIFFLQIKHTIETNKLISPGAYNINNTNKIFQIAKIIELIE